MGFSDLVKGHLNVQKLVNDLNEKDLLIKSKIWEKIKALDQSKVYIVEAWDETDEVIDTFNRQFRELKQTAIYSPPGLIVVNRKVTEAELKVLFKEELDKFIKSCFPGKKNGIKGVGSSSCLEKFSGNASKAKSMPVSSRVYSSGRKRSKN